MIITISGDPGSGKSTAAKEIAKHLRLNHYSGGDMRGLLAKDHGMTIDELNKLGENDPSTDRDIDERIAKLGKEEDGFVIDSRLAWHFIPQSIKIYLTTDVRVAAQRIFKDIQLKDKAPVDRSDEPEYKDVDDVVKHIKARVASDKKRYKKYYDIDHTDMSHYDLVLDTTALTLPQTVERILAFVQKFK
ncbi:MAG: (d)CMP kinase [Nanoarchaeota archaeon]